MIPAIWYWIGRTLTKLFAPLLFQFDLQSDSPLPAGAKILVANHPSSTDPILVATLFKERTCMLILDTLFKVPLVGRSLSLAGHIPVVPGSGQAALDEALRMLQAGRTVVIFPEGLISPAGGFHRARTGAARLALMSGAPVVPIGIYLDAGRLHRIETKVEGTNEVGTWYMDGPYAVTVGAPLHFQGNVEDREQVQYVTQRIMAHITALSMKSAIRMHASAARRQAAWKSLRPQRLAHWMHRRAFPFAVHTGAATWKGSRRFALNTSQLLAGFTVKAARAVYFFIVAMALEE
ncbi:MAG: lysophospholipid acyltransferase family protein [Anaerolineaceae bacterium]|nr:lysophospholipid acyltransferase family protein [Anaerolineaceae bacterium]